MVRWNGGSKTVDASSTRTSISGLSNGTSYRFTVEARNGFAADGGVSPRSKESNAVKPYKKPAKPTVSGSNGKCTDGNSCPVTVKASAGGSDGGAGGKTLQVRINDGSWQDSGTSFSKTYQVKTGGNVKIEARVKNSKGLVSGTVSKTQDAQTYTPPAPKSDVRFGTTRFNTASCDSEYCRQVHMTLTDLEPDKTYELQATLDQRPGDTFFPGGPIRITAREDGTWSSDAEGHKWAFGYPNESFTVVLDGKDIGSYRYPG